MTDERQIDGETYAEKDGSGNLVIKNIDEATIEKILDAAGTTVYNASTKTVGDGTTDANHSSLSTDSASVTNQVDAGSLSTATHTSKVSNEVRQVGAGKRFSTIQAAHDDLPSTGGIISYDYSYDSSAESFPISLTKPHVLSGNHRTAIENTGTDAVLNNDIGATTAPNVGWKWEDVHVIGGGDSATSTPATNIDARWGTVLNCTFSQSDYIGVEVTSNSNYFYSSFAWQNGDEGVKFSGTANSCNWFGGGSTSNGSDGFRIDGVVSSWVIGAQAEGNADTGVFISSDTISCGVTKTYMEDNATAGVYLQGENPTASYLYGNGLDDVSYMVLVSSITNRAEVRNLTGTRYTSGLIEVGSNPTDTDVHTGSHVSLDGTNIISADNGVRTRSNGVIAGGLLGGVDLRGVTGANAGDIALTTGGSSAPANVLALFDGTDWVYPSLGGTVTP